MTLPGQTGRSGIRPERHPDGRRPAETAREKVLLDREAVERTLSRIAHEIIEGNPELDQVALVGIQTRGVPLAQRLRALREGRRGAAARRRPGPGGWTSRSIATTSPSAPEKLRAMRGPSCATRRSDSHSRVAQ